VIQQQKETIKIVSALTEETMTFKATIIALGVSTSNVASVNGS
jgi:hypothetical protein